MHKKIGIIGFGNMGSAIAERLKKDFEVFVFDKDKLKTKNFKGINVAENVIGLVSNVDTVIVAVKPQDFENLLNEIKDFIKNKLIISIAAGITTKYIEKRMGKVKVIRVMPNMPARIGKGMSCLCKGGFTCEEELSFAKKLFNRLGKTLVLQEEMMDGATAISGSGPGFLYDFIENKNSAAIRKFADEVFMPSLSASAERIGFSKEQAKILASATTSGSLFLLEATKLPASDLKRQIASKGGTTEAGLEVLHNGGTLEDAVKAALKRAKQLSRR